jgi:hypothetical protein
MITHEDAPLDRDTVLPGTLQSAIFNSANSSRIATDAKGVIQIFTASTPGSVIAKRLISAIPGAHAIWDPDRQTMTLTVDGTVVCRIRTDAPAWAQAVMRRQGPTVASAHQLASFVREARTGGLSRNRGTSGTPTGSALRRGRPAVTPASAQPSAGAPAGGHALTSSRGR